MVCFDDFQFREGDVVEMVESYEEARNVDEVFAEAERVEEMMRLKALHAEEAGAESVGTNASTGKGDVASDGKGGARSEATAAA